MKNIMIKSIFITVFIIIQIIPQQIDSLQSRNHKMLGIHLNNLETFRVKNIKGSTNLFFWRKLNGPLGGAINGLQAFGDTILVGLGYNNQSIYYSSNQGESWNKSNINIPVDGASDFTKVGSTYFSSLNDAGIYKSSNLKDWVNVRKDGSSYWSIGSDMMGRIFAGRYYSGGITGSIDSGKTWKDEQNLKSIVYDFLLTPKGTTLASSWNVGITQKYNQILRRDKNSSQWSQKDFNFISSTNLYICQNLKDSIIYLIPMNRPYCLVSTDDGLTWINHDTSGFIRGLYSQDVTLVNNTLIIGGTPDEFLSGWGIAVSDDKGYTWRYSNSGLPPYARVNKLTTSNNEVLAGLYGGGIYKSIDNGNTWKSSMEGIYSATTSQISLNGDSIIYSASWGEGIQKSTDRGMTFTNISSPLFPDWDRYGVLYYDSILFCGGDGGLHISYDNGDNWIQKDNLGTYKIFRDRNGNIFRLAYSGIIKSSNKGIDWYYKNNGINTDDMGYAFACDSSGNLYYGTYMGNIYKSTNEGENWTLVRNGANPQAFLFSISVSPKNNYIYAASDREGLFKSTDEGMTWENIFPELDGNTVYVNQKGEVFAFDYNGGIFYSNNEGSNWTDITNNLDYINVKDVKEDSKGNLILGTWDGIYISDDPALNVDNKYNGQVHSYSLSQNYPNPFNPSTKIKYTLPKQGLVTIKIFDVLGIEIKQLINEEKPSGEYEVEFDGSSLSSGIYFYQIQAGEFTATKKMVLMK